MGRRTIQHFSPDYIVEFCRKHPIDWMNAHKEKAQRGGDGDKASRHLRDPSKGTPTPAMEEFLNLLDGNDLFSQEEYERYCFSLADSSARRAACRSWRPVSGNHLDREAWRGGRARLSGEQTLLVGGVWGRTLYYRWS